MWGWWGGPTRWHERSGRCWRTSASSKRGTRVSPYRALTSTSTNVSKGLVRSSKGCEGSIESVMANRSDRDPPSLDCLGGHQKSSKEMRRGSADSIRASRFSLHNRPDIILQPILVRQNTADLSWQKGGVHITDMIFRSLACACALESGARNRSGFTKTSAAAVRSVLRNGPEPPSRYQTARAGLAASTVIRLYRAGQA